MEIMFVILRLQQVLSCNHSSTNGTLEAGNVQVDEVFLPYMTDGKGRTLYQAYQHGQLMLGDGQRREDAQ